MSNLNDVGISPVLLQAISQSLSSTTSEPPVTAVMESPNPTPDESGAAVNQQLAVRFLKQQHEQANVAQNTRDPASALQSDTIKTMLKIKMAANALTKAYAADTKRSEDNVVSGSSASDLAMANVLTALASQSGKGFIAPNHAGDSSMTFPGQNGGAAQHPSSAEVQNVKELEYYRPIQVGNQKLLIRTRPDTGVSEIEKEEELEHVDATHDGSGELNAGQTTCTMIKPEPDLESLEPVKLERQSTVSNILMSDANKSSFVGSSLLLSDTQASQSTSVVTSPESGPGTQLVFSFNPTASTSDVATDNRFKVIEHEGKRYILQTHDYDPAGQVSDVCTQSTEEAQTYTVQIGADDGMTYTSVAEQEVVTVGQQQEEADGMAMSAYPMSAGLSGTPCPICGDNVSGFHYGIFTCESCKGFFKRTVQNKKSFVCPRSGECEIVLGNRKKCPACRFAKCLVMGMKLEAIRQDRMRGGRSSYGGSSPFEEKRKRPIKIVQRRPSLLNLNESTLVSVLNSGTQRPEKPFVPQILTDIMNLESLLCDDDIPASISAEDFTISNPNVFLTLLQLCELKLYKIVRWARNLPYFANISTDDQILLLQNCWCELLALTLCWKSLQLTNEIIFFHGQAIDLDKACTLDLGEMFSKMLAVVEQFKRLKVDQYECVALKVIILICPDIKGLNDTEKLSEQQQRVSMALEAYMYSHYRQCPSKYGEILLRLPELSRISCMLKDHLMTWMPANTTSCGLLYELLKGENMKDLV